MVQHITKKMVQRMATNRFLFLVALLSLIYLFLDTVLSEFFLYLIGGVLGAIVSFFTAQVNELSVVFLWIILFGITTYLYYRSDNKIVKYISLLFIMAFIYVVDLIFSRIISFDSPLVNIRYLTIVFLAIAKALIVSFVIYRKHRKVIVDKVDL